MQVNIKVTDITDPDCVWFEDGKTIGDMVSGSLASGYEVKVDFSGVRVCVSSFLAGFVGTLPSDYPADVLNTRLQILNMSPYHRDTLRKVVANYLMKNKNY